MNAGAWLKILHMLLLAALAHSAEAFDPFTVRDIRVEGVQRTDAGTVFNYLPIKVGDRVRVGRTLLEVRP